MKYDAQGHITGTSDVGASDLPSHTHDQYLTSHQDITGKENTSNKVTSWSSTTTDTHYPSEKLVKESIDSVLSNIPTATSELTNDCGFLTSHQDISGKIDTAGTGLSKSGTTLNHSNSVTALTTASFKKVKYDSQGHITRTSDFSASE